MPIRFSVEDVARFARWSGDCNPLHVDAVFARQTHFGENIVHGILTVLEAFREAPLAGDRTLRSLDIEFRGAVVAGGSYEVTTSREDDVATVTLAGDGQPVLVARAETGSRLERLTFADTSWTLAARNRGPRTSPATHAIDEFERGLEITGAYREPRESLATPGFTPIQARTLALCSYVVGMEAPGLKSLFTRLRIEFSADAGDAADLLYRARTVRFDRVFRLLDIELEVVDGLGTPVASGLIRSYVPYSPAAVDPTRLARLSDPSLRHLGEKVALVLGGSRGLGADLAATLALARAHVYVSSRRDDQSREELHRAVAARGCSLTFLQGDAGDAEWCASALATIASRHERLDLLVLNACEPPVTQALDPHSRRQNEDYLLRNLRLIQTPLATFLPLLDDSSGTVVFISSTAVDQPSAGWSQYVAVKQAGEGLVRTVAAERPRLYSLIVRPPALLTRWSDTPSRVAAALPPEVVAVRIARQVNHGWRAGAVDVMTEFPVDDATVCETHDEMAAPRDFMLRVAASFTTDPLLPAFRFWARELDLDAGVDAAAYGQVLQSLLDPASPFNGKGRGFNVLFLRVSDWMRELAEEQAEDDHYVVSYLQRTAHDFEAAIRAHRQQATADTLLLFCPSDPALPPAITETVAKVVLQLKDVLRGTSGLEIVDVEEYHPHYRVREDEIHDALRDEIGHIPFRDEYLFTLATIAVRHAYRRIAPIRKVVAVDCDNTLWRGVVGEVGAEGVEIDEGHRALHRTLARLAQSGVLVCLCSKNDEPDVWRVFDTREDLLLRREHVVAAMVNWLPKSQNLKTLASRLNLGLDSFMFVDDNPVECAEVRSGCPEVLTIEWPQDPGDAVRLLEHAWEFDVREATKEDIRRTQMYREEFQRQDLRSATHTFQDFVRSLELEVTFAAPSEEEFKRAAQLTLRTNQFNFTTIRREEADIRALMAGGRHEVRTVKVRDRFGDYGLVGLLIAERGDDVWTLDTFLLSCRVLGRGVEHHIAAELGRMAAASGARAVRLRVEPTRRNTPARTFLQSIVPADLLQGFESEMPVETLSAVEFDPASGAADILEDRPAISSAPATQTADLLRRREAQIVKAAFTLGSGAGLRGAITGSPAAQPPVAVTDTDISATVRSAFATALRTPAERVAQVDRLEALGCDSLRIVEITVALRERFPWLPSTLLFEHRTVSAIVAEITALASKGPGADAAVPAESARVIDDTQRRRGDIAVVGMHVRCAGANSPAELWHLLSRRASAVRPVAANRPQFLKPLTDTRNHWAGLLDDVARFDAELFGISPREAEVMDPQTRLFLEVAWNALEDAGCVGADHEPATGVFAGVMYADYGFAANLAPAENNSAYRCWEGFSLANRLSQLLGFGGPSLAVDTACSSSATALHLACNALKSGDCPVAVVGGVNLILDPDRFASLGRLGILSERGLCEPFGATADGTVLGEGAGVVVLRPLEDALRRGDRIYGVIKGTGISTGNGTVGFTAPNPQAQADAIRRSLTTAGIDPRTVTYIEAHGTGTGLGDPIEVRGLTLGYDRPELRDASLPIAQSSRIGSIKPNVGHLEAGAGIMGLIKVLLQLHHGMLLPSITSEEPSPAIAFARGIFDVQRELEPWQRRTIRSNGAEVTIPRRAGLSAFGVGGANAHVIIEEAPATAGAAGAVSRPDDTQADRPAHVLALSARSADALQRQAASVRRYVDGDASLSLADFCYTANVGRRHFEHRLAVPFATREELLQALKLETPDAQPRRGVRGLTAAVRPKIAFLFTGQGAQYAGMGRQLYASQPVFREALDRCSEVFSRHLDRPLLELLFAEDGSADADLINQTGYTQPALFSFEYAMSALWQSWGIRPDVVLGHSVGEIAAMCVAGGVSLEDGLKLIAARGRLMQALPAGGTMTSVMADERRVLEALEGEEQLVAIAAINAPSQVVISGAGSAVATVTARLEAAGVKAKALTVSHAFHSPLMKPMLADYERVVREIRFTPPRTALVSGVTAAIAGDEITRPDYWLRNVMDPVRFAAGMRSLEAAQVTAYVEVGPHPVLLGMGRQSVEDEAAAAWLPSARKEGDAWQTLLGSAARLHVLGAQLDWNAFDAPYRRRRVAVPPYAFGGRQYWLKGLKDQRKTGALARAAAPEIITQPAVYQVVWRKATPLVPGPAPRRWIVLTDSNETSAELERVLRTQGASVTTVVAGRRFGETENSFTIDPSSRDDVDRLFDRVTLDEGTRIVHLWSLDAKPADGESLITGATHVVQALAARGVAKPAVWFVTRDAVAVDAAAPPAIRPISPVQAATWGFGRTVALEHPELWGGLVDVDRLDHEGASLLAQEIGADVADDQVALRNGERFVPRLVRRETAAAFPRTLDPAGTYVVTGGTGALGLKVAQWLVDRGARRLMAVSRRASVEGEARAQLEQLQRRGVSVTLFAADISRPQEVDALLQSIASSGAPLRGIVHAAGVDVPMPLTALTPDDIRNVLAPKLDGSVLLHERTRDLPLDLFVAFSSVSAILGSQGRAHYAAANASLDALIAERSRLGLPAVGVNWGPWKGGGMATDAQLQQFERIGNRGLDPAAAISALDALVGEGSIQASIIDIDWTVFAPVYASRRARPFISDVAPDTHDTASAPTAEGTTWLERLGAMAVDRRRSELERLVRGEVAQTLGFDDGSSVAVERNFYDMGMDSLLMADLVGRLKVRLGMPCSTLVFEHPTVSALSTALFQRLPLDSPAPANASATAPNAAEDRVQQWPARANAVSDASSSTLPQRDAPIAPLAEAEILEFQKVAFPSRTPALVVPRWRWMFIESAKRLGVEPKFWVHREQGQIVAQMGSIPVRLKIGGDHVDTGWLVDTMVREEYRTQALGSRLLVRAHEDQPFSMSLGQSAEARDILRHLGWKHVAPLQTAQALVRARNVFKTKLPSALGWAAGATIDTSSAVARRLRPRRRLEVRTVDRFDGRHDRLWQRVADEYTTAVVRDASYLNWKYVDQPGQDLMRLELSENGEVVAVAVWALREADGIYGYRRALLYDLVSPLLDPALLRDVIANACTAPLDAGADALVCLHISGKLTAALRACGFALREPTRHLLVDPGTLTGRMLDGVLAADRWFVTQGDSDIDRPW